jgi:hypothetical protein
MTSPVNNPKNVSLLPPVNPTNLPAPAGISDAPTVLESGGVREKKEEKMEPGVFETLVVRLIHFIILIFTPLWNGLFEEKTENRSK